MNPGNCSDGFIHFYYEIAQRNCKFAQAKDLEIINTLRKTKL